jgi:hypothetical protein
VLPGRRHLLPIGFSGSVLAAPVAAARPMRLTTVRESRRVLWRVGFAATAVSALRSSRNTLLPLWATSLGLDATTIALIVGVGSALDVSPFYVAWRQAGDGQQRDAEVANAREESVERCLIGNRAAQDGGAVLVPPELEAPQPFSP